MSRATVEIYFSVDVEADGPIPGPYSMVSLGACAAALRGRDAEITVLDADKETFYRELRPISEKWDADALAVSGLSREHLTAHGGGAVDVMRDFADWVDHVAGSHGARPVFAAYPVGFDWQFTYHYLIAYAGRSPFGHSAHFDMKTAYAILAGTAVRDAVKRNMPRSLLGSRPHTHNALDDAKGQADLLVSLLTWPSSARGNLPPP
jgi:hypothetical protein